MIGGGGLALDPLVWSLEKMAGIRVKHLEFFFFFLSALLGKSSEPQGQSHRALFDVSRPPGNGRLPHAPFKSGLLPTEERPIAAT